MVWWMHAAAVYDSSCCMAYRTYDALLLAMQCTTHVFYYTVCMHCTTHPLNHTSTALRTHCTVDPLHYAVHPTKTTGAIILCV